MTWQADTVAGGAVSAPWWGGAGNCLLDDEARMVTVMCMRRDPAFPLPKCACGDDRFHANMHLSCPNYAAGGKE